jgi:hypothetical protein
MTDGDYLGLENYRGFSSATEYITNSAAKNLNYPITTSVESDEKTSTVVLPFGIVTTNGATRTHDFTIPSLRMFEEYGLDQPDRLFYALAIVKAYWGENVDPIMATSHFTSTESANLLEKHKEELSYIELLRDIWALDLINQMGNKLWLEHIGLMPKSIDAFTVVSDRYLGKKTLFWGHENFMIAVLRGSLKRGQRFESESVRELFYYCESYLLNKITDEKSLNQLIKLSDFLAEIPYLTYSVPTDPYNLFVTSNRLLELMEARCRIHMYKIEYQPPSEPETPSKYLMSVIPT